MAKLIVMMSTYNGERFLEEQLDSILSQDFSNFRIIVRDDGSTDRTVDILERYSMKDERLTYYKGKNLGARDSFYDLMQNVSDYDYYAFCDQDDVWDNDKLRIAVEKLEQYDKSIPLLYCSNLSVVDEELNQCRLCHDITFHLDNKYLALTEYPAVGCTEVYNKTAMDLIRPTIPNNATMHDAWVYMCCQFFGKVIYDNTAHILYRQHGKNVIGANKSMADIWYERIRRLFDVSLQPRYNNAMVFNTYFGDNLRGKDKKILDTLLLYKTTVSNRIKAVQSKELVAESIERTIRLKLLTIWGLL